MREAMQILKQLIMKGEINDRDDRELFSYINNQEIRDNLDILAEEWDFKLIQAQHELYIVPLSDNELFNVKLREIRESVSSVAKNIDAYLQCYIIMVILWRFFGSKNSNPQRESFLQIKDIMASLDERFLSIETAEIMEDTMQINFRRISAIWRSKAATNDGRKSSKIELIKNACRILQKNALIEFYDNDEEIRPKNKLITLMKNYYLDERRIDEIHQIFERGKTNAGN